MQSQQQHVNHCTVWSHGVTRWRQDQSSLLPPKTSCSLQLNLGPLCHWKSMSLQFTFPRMNLCSPSSGGSPVSELRCCMSRSGWGGPYHMLVPSCMGGGKAFLASVRGRTGLKRWRTSQYRKGDPRVGQPKIYQLSTPWGLE